MEIFKAASQQIDNSVALNMQKETSKAVRGVEGTKIQNNVVKDESNQNAMSNEEIVKKLNDITSKLNQNMEQLQTNIRFGFNDKISSMYVNVMEADSGKVIRKIPSEAVMNLTEHLREVVGVLFDKKE
ncbi:flagellar protein FlaG [Campylobacter iguaniorum]|uniref:Flagellar protein FlaG n=1 Tax=Campylobacter iguaniorum TaxID=1244531 RepID=A0A076F9L2_9BACT|nr:FlaG family protein [Campylobacter iguaniorum]AII14368.1 flagellar protein FlaG [Campylobacter iguaniorum]ALV24104.1 flagellar protein FlaG [Campylobacter iguaniorum]